MKLDVDRKDGTVEIRRHNDDGSITLWLCDSDQAALYKLASLVMDQPENPKMKRRSILVGTFTPEEKKPTLEELAERRKAELEKEGMTKRDEQPKKAPAAMPKDLEEFTELLKSLGGNKEYKMLPEVHPFMPSPAIGPYPYGAEPIWVGGLPKPPVYGGDTINICGDGHFIDVAKNSDFNGKTFSCATVDEPLQLTNSAAGVNLHGVTEMFRTSLRINT